MPGAEPISYPASSLFRNRISSVFVSGNIRLYRSIITAREPTAREPSPGIIFNTCGCIPIKQCRETDKSFPAFRPLHDVLGAPDVTSLSYAHFSIYKCFLMGFVYTPHCIKFPLCLLHMTKSHMAKSQQIMAVDLILSRQIFIKELKIRQ